MFKKIFAYTLAMLLLVASMGYAANMQVTSSAVPVSGGTITPSGIKFYPGAATYNAAPKAGWSLTNVTIDGVVTVAPYTVPFDTSKIHTVKANFAQTLYSITTTAGSGGSIQITGGGNTNITPGSTRGYIVAPGTGSQIASLTVDGAAVTAAVGSTVAISGSWTNIQASHTVAATFKVLSSTAVSAGPNQTAAPGTITLNGSAFSNVLPIIYHWNIASGPNGSSLGTPTAATTNFTAITTGIYTVTLTANNVVSAPATITVVNPGVISAGSNVCINCHAGSSPVVEYSASGHAKSASGPSCSTCHTGADTSHPGTTVTSATCESCHTAPVLSQVTHPADITASKCLQCHNSHDPAADIANLGQASAHPAVTLYTFEEIGMQMAGGAKVPVQVDANGKGMPYSPKQTCGTSGCHVKNGVDYTYDKISDHAFHSNQGRSEYVDSSDGKFNAAKNKPWTQSTAMVGKW
jgi:hypothetical protein